MKSKKIVLRIIVLIALGIFAEVYFSGQVFSANQPENISVRKKPNVVVKVIPVKKEDFTLTIDYVGSLKAKDEANVYSKVPGKLLGYSVNEGDAVSKGQIIASIDRDETGLKFEQAKVESPISGIIGRILLDKGSSVQANITPLAIVVSMEEMVVRLNIPEQDIPYFKRGLDAIIKVDAYPDMEFAGKISRVAEIVDVQTRTLPIEVAIANDDYRLKSGMFTRIKIIAAKLKNVLVLPEDAVVQELGEKFVFTVEDNTANKKKVILGKRDNDKLEVLDGVTEGETVIIFGQQGLKDGSPVQINNKD